MYLLQLHDPRIYGYDRNIDVIKTNRTFKVLQILIEENGICIFNDIRGKQVKGINIRNTKGGSLNNQGISVSLGQNMSLSFIYRIEQVVMKMT